MNSIRRSSNNSNSLVNTKFNPSEIEIAKKF